MSSYFLFIAGLMLVSAVQAYTQVNFASPFMLKNIDPIVFPGQHGKSHLHSFFGSDAVTIDTKTSAELQQGCTNAQNPNDLSVYWIPTPLYTTDGQDYQPIPIVRFSAYYNLGEPEAEVAMPQDLKMVAGDATAKTQADMPAAAKSQWSCENGGGGALDANGFPSETCGTHLHQLLYFPQCVNLETLETAYTNLYGTNNSCPEGMKRMPQLRFSIRYNLRSVLPNGWSGGAPFKLSCGPAWCSHGDFINGWTKEAAQEMIATTSKKMSFAPINGALGKYNAGPICEAKDADPSNGTGDYAESVGIMGKRNVPTWGWQSKSRTVRSA